jgi:caffeoyl-CoA O-methyltransferase
MHTKFTALTPELYDYLLSHCSAVDELLVRLIEETEQETGAASLMQIAQDQGAFMTMLTKLCGARNAVEVGTFTGYSAICIARGLPRDGNLLCCDISEQWTAIARRYWAEAEVDDRITLELGPAVETLRALPPDRRFDLAFIDADKNNYINYYEEILSRMDSGGLLVFDNVFWMGWVVDPAMKDAETEGIRALNDFVAGDPRVEAVMVPVGDGLTLARKN